MRPPDIRSPEIRSPGARSPATRAGDGHSFAFFEPHTPIWQVGIAEFCETKKAYFLGYMVHKLLMSSMGARRPDDRDHYAQKRLDLAGPLLGQLFRARRARCRACAVAEFGRRGCDDCGSLPLASSIRVLPNLLTPSRTAPPHVTDVTDVKIGRAHV